MMLSLAAGKKFETKTATEMDLFAKLTQGIKLQEPVKEVKKIKEADEPLAPPETTKLSTRKAFLKQHRISTTGYPANRNFLHSFADIPATETTALAVASIQHTLAETLEWETPSAIQIAAIPCLMPPNPVDVIASAETGSGKTGAFVIPMLIGLGPSHCVPGTPRALVVSPTRELANQTAKVIQTFIDGGVDLRMITLAEKKDERRLQKEGCDILIVTPNHLVHLMGDEGNNVTLTSLRYFILDEADRLLDQQFFEVTERLLAAAHGRDKDPEKDLRDDLSLVLFSATLAVTNAVKDVLDRISRASVVIKIGTNSEANRRIKQELVYAGLETQKLAALRTVLRRVKLPALIFTQSKDRAVDLQVQVTGAGVKAAAFHGDLPQRMRDRAMREMQTGKIWALITTDVMARGIDFDGIKSVINYDFPQSPAAYIHRIGRTGRSADSEQEASAITLITDEDRPYLQIVRNVMKSSGCHVPEWMYQVKGARRDEVKRLQKVPLDRGDIDKRRKAMDKHYRGKGKGGGKKGGRKE
ncbi:DEAD/DEAH box helicase [Carpediemonas membranifera]|uniref:ATP-dependent RNA helicase n=1 Tax=Carpediemonas membranifera TaxID=201153 RepID=A0A8J6B5W3_9EUKA|nr:DEAD/DEAH box helicase [Carpediemonas membranifera]|eukprot:KAG9393719.1 DEAD/DEAH box helicase [Carpediemonas membranifera]